jgi:hypothetical protein
MKQVSMWILATIGAAMAATAADYHADSRTGDDSQDGLTPKKAWRSLAKVNEASLQPGDRVLFHAGSVWTGQLVVKCRGNLGGPIRFESFGSGARPRIDAGGACEDAVLLRNARYVEVRDLELTNRGTNGAPRRGVHIIADNSGTLPGIVVSDLFIHDVRGTQEKKDNGGIIFRTLGSRIPSRFDGLRIERNIIWRVDRSGIAAQSYHSSRTRWFPSQGVLIRDNWVGDAGGDGIVPWATDGAIVEHNIVQGANERAGSFNAGIWPWSTDNTVMRLNRASGVKTLKDGQGFDSDYNCRNTLIEFNLSHENDGGFLLICTPGKRKQEDNLGNVGTVVRYNISRDDRARIFHISAAEKTLIHDNAIYIGKGLDVQMLLLSDWSGWAKDLEFRNNLFVSDGIARYGQQASRGEDGSFEVKAGWGPAQEVRFHDNRYEGRHLDKPQEAAASQATAPAPVPLHWPGPLFNPEHPETFRKFIPAHRTWMIGLMEKQFHRKPVLTPDRSR